MPRYLHCAFAGMILGLLIGVPLAYTSWQNKSFRNFHIVDEGVLYRSGQLSHDALKRLIHDRQIKTVVTLRYAPGFDRPAPDLDEENFCKREGLNHFRLSYLGWVGPDDKLGGCSVPAEVNVRKFLEIMKDRRNHPVLVHCFAGIHRTGALCAVYRMEFDGWTPARAMREMRELGYTAHHRDVFKYLENYRPRFHHGEPLAEPASIDLSKSAD